jgi:hypothetical protein
VRKPEAKRKLLSPRRRQMDKVSWRIGWDGVNWTHQAEDIDDWKVLVSTIVNLRVP